LIDDPEATALGRRVTRAVTGDRELIAAIVCRARDDGELQPEVRDQRERSTA
jgi:hypothetical protein